MTSWIIYLQKNLGRKEGRRKEGRTDDGLTDSVLEVRASHSLKRKERRGYQNDKSKVHDDPHGQSPLHLVHISYIGTIHPTCQGSLASQSQSSLSTESKQLPPSNMALTPCSVFLPIVMFFLHATLKMDNSCCMTLSLLREGLTETEWLSLFPLPPNSSLYSQLKLEVQEVSH